MLMDDQEESQNVEDVRGSSGGFRPIHGIGLGYHRNRPHWRMDLWRQSAANIGLTQWRDVLERTERA